ECNLDLHAIELSGYVLHDLAAKVDRVADRLLPAVEIGEGQRAFAVAERDRAGALDLLERSGNGADIRRLLRVGRRGEHDDGRRGKNNRRPAPDPRSAGPLSSRVPPPQLPHSSGCGLTATSSPPTAPFPPSH